VKADGVLRKQHFKEEVFVITAQVAQLERVSDFGSESSNLPWVIKPSVNIFFTTDYF